MLYAMMQECRNYFDIPDAAFSGNFAIVGGEIDLPDLLPNQFYIIEGSVFNDGLHMVGEPLTDETFYGVIRPLAVPQAFQRLSERVAAFAAASAPSAFSSESFAGYSYTQATGRNGAQLNWQTAFASELAPWRKI